MNERLRTVWIPGFLFVITLGLALTMAGAVVLAPSLVGETTEHPLLLLYAHDSTVRQTSLASALGLLVTAFVFFRPAGWFGKQVPKPDSSANIAGA